MCALVGCSLVWQKKRAKDDVLKVVFNNEPEPRGTDLPSASLSKQSQGFLWWSGSTHGRTVVLTDDFQACMFPCRWL